MPRCPTCETENRDGARFCDACGTALTGRSSIERRTVATLLFCDVVRSTSLGERVDPEAVREIMLRYFDAMRGAIELHGGTVEKFIGDAVMAVFGVPAAHEDDALRAVRSAMAMRERLAELNAELERAYGATIDVRIGINTGEVVAGDGASDSTLVTGDAVNVAARLEQLAAPGEILIGGVTYELVRADAVVEPRPPLDLPGRVEPVAAHRLVSVGEADAQRRPRRAALVGRSAELGIVAGVYGQVCAKREAGAVTVIGEAGIGKSQLSRAFLDAATPEPRVLSARCVPYGEGVTYQPLVHLLRQAAGIVGDHDREEARACLAAAVSALDDAADVLQPLEQLLGLADGVASASQIARAARRLVESTAAEQPVVVLVDDLQWAEAPLADLLEALARRGRAPILVLGLARPELRETERSSIAVDVQLGPLDGTDAAELAGRLLGGRALDPVELERLLAVAGGNPLFLEELVSFVEGGGSVWSEIPPGLEALLLARLDGLPAHERIVIERASVEGEVFHRGAMVALAAGEEVSALDSSLDRLQLRGLIRTTHGGRPGEQAYRFRHLLVRDVAYRSTPKRRRADLHKQYADWLEEHLGDRLTEEAEVVAYHLEQSWRLRRELGRLDEEGRRVGDHASMLLAQAGSRSLARGDARAASSLFATASELTSDPVARVEHRLRHGAAAREAGAFSDSEASLLAVRAAAAEQGWRGLEAGAEVELAMLSVHTRSLATGDRLREAGERSLATFEALGDDRGMAVARVLLARERWLALRCAEMEQTLELALEPAERSGDQRLVAAVLIGLAQAALFGPRPADDAVPYCEGLLERARAIGPMPAASISMMLAPLEASLGNTARARALSDESKAVIEEFAPGPTVGGAGQYAGLASLISGDAEHAERELRAAGEVLEAFGERAVASTVAALRARALVELGRHEEAEQLAVLGLGWADPGDVATQAYARGALARSLAARGAAEEAEQNARRAVALSEESDFLNQRGDALLDLALVLRAVGDRDGAHQAAVDALAFYESKGNLVSAAGVATLLAD